MEENAIRRIPSIEDRQLIAIPSTADLALAHDRQSAGGGAGTARPDR